MLEIIIKDEEFLASLEVESLETSIFNDARSATGFPYFYPVDLGRGPVFPKNAKALKIPMAGAPGGFIFRRSAGPAAPRNIRQQALGQLEGSAINAAITAGGATPRGWFASFLNGMARFYSQVLADVTPRGPSGKLGSSYRPTTTA
jgi:hypothetical protein